MRTSRLTRGTARKSRRAALLALPVALVTTLTASGTAHAEGEGPAAAYSATTSVGVHNAYEQAKYPYLADALDSGAGLLEIDVWTNSLGGPWRVAHSNPLGNASNCENAQSPAELRTKPRNQGLAGCLADLRAWHDAHPGHRPIMLKIEMKDGFNDRGGRGPDEFDALVGQALGDAVFRPADLVGGHATLDEAVRATGWPGRDALAGKFILELIPGTVEESNPFDSLWTDREYANRLRDLAAAGRLRQATAFPAVHKAEAGDPRVTRYADASIRPWFVVFDGDASAYVANGIDTAWYDQRHYLLVMTDAHGVAPAIDGTRPTESEARARAELLARNHASVLTADWYPLPAVLGSVLPRG
ncbi:phosphatidylinositol-specific phospholipase C domain-containing protein [Streptomyces sp. NPDC018031]|uniref:phosphatidylinositol-specific phospholipase C domain-containing protein n=1 Tax=Streptomyces sp. NPDC018031 TaxID=3365033 RepID=UPI0037983A5A